MAELTGKAKVVFETLGMLAYIQRTCGEFEYPDIENKLQEPIDMLQAEFEKLLKEA
jgi:hypothetical protein